jgi:hypothetical protein
LGSGAPRAAAAPTDWSIAAIPRRTASVDLTKLLWRIERDYLDLKREVGLGHYEGRGWRGFYHHATLCIAAYGSLISETETISPQGLPVPSAARNLQFPVVIDPEVLPLRSQRHMPNSIARLRIRLARTPGSRITTMSLLWLPPPEPDRAE